MSTLSRRLVAAAVSAALGIVSLSAHAADGKNGSGFELSVLGSYSTGLGAGAAEIVSYDKQSRRLFTINAAASSVDILSVANPAAPTLIKRLDLSALGSPNSVDAHDGVIAVAIQAPVKTDAGKVGFYTVDGELLGTVPTGSLPDMLTFTPDGRHVLVANEGEPSGYGAPTDVDPEGSVTIIEVPKNKKQWQQLGPDYVKTVNFRQFDGQEAALRAQGVRIYGPGASASQDFEPEYIAVGTDSEFAYVTLQENNAIAEIDVEEGKLTRLSPLGFKDYRAKPSVSATYEWTDLPTIGYTTAGQEFLLGGFSALAFEGRTRDGKLKFITSTDRGPNAEPTGILRPFLLPDFTPRLVRFTLDPADGRFELVEQILLKRANGRKLTGLPNTALSADTNQAYNDEVPVDLFGNQLPLDPLGGDFECVVVAADGTFWMGDEYRPAIYHFDRKGLLLQRYVPIGTHAAAGKPVPAPGVAGEFGIEALPAVIAQRRQNRGVEALAQQNGKLYAFVQSPIRNPVTLANGTLNAMKNVRVVEFDPNTLATRQFLYEMDNPAPLNAADTRADKIGDATATPSGEFLVVERDDDAVPASDVSVITKKVYSFTLGNASDVTGLESNLYPVVRNGVTSNLSIDQMTTAELAAIGVRSIAKTLHVDLARAGYASVQKVEGLTVLDDGRLAVVNDNDFGVAQIVVDKTTGTFTTAPGYTPEKETLGLIDVPGLDASDRDSKINIRDWPLFGIYEPDSIAAYDDIKGRTFLVTANEGDARDWPGYAEEARVSTLTLDPVAFPDAATLKNNANLGRHTVTKSLGDFDGDGDYDALFTLGGRSFSIWSATGEQVYDSGSQFERITAFADPAHFNASNDNTNFDDRSDNKGPEPEGVAVGKIDDRTYAFIGFERVGGIAMYDVTDPRAPFFVDYLNNRNFAAGTGDAGPEGVHFISAKESPNGQPIVAVANEISGTVTLYAVKKK
ncbi:MAG TPA: choice-of-anchor I family protein [Steroidobacteraceae bacterium]|nr:choice-of-anchor I family protein [Steroidobacteraceae bacterium]